MPTSYKDDNDQDERLNPGGAARDLYRQEQDSYDREFNGIADNFDKSADDSKENSNIKNLRDDEEKAGDWKNNTTSQPNNVKQQISGKAKLLKRGGPLGIIGLLVGGGFGLSFLLSPALLLPHITKILTNDRSDITSALEIRGERLLLTKISSTSKRFGYCGSKVTIRCKFSTMSAKEAEGLRKKGIIVNGEKRFAGTRTSVTSITFPDGQEIKDPAELRKKLREPSAANAYREGVKAKTRPFLSKKFSSMLANRFGLSKASKVSGDNKEKITESYKKAIGADKATGEAGRFNKALQSARGVPGQKTAVGISAACLAYNTSRNITNSVKATKAAAFAGFALVFLTEADKLVAGDADPAVIDKLATQLTSSEQNKLNEDGTPNPKYNKTATDSEGFKLAAYGDVNKLPGYSEQYLLGGGATMGILSGLVSKVDKSAGGRSNVRAACLAAKALEPVAALQCLAGPFAAAVCVAAATAFTVFLPRVVKHIITNLSKLELDDNTIGVQAGDALFVGAGVIMGGMAQSHGMKPSSAEEATEYLAYTQENKNRREAAEKYLAKQEPFNIYNQYSFMGSLASQLQLYQFTNSSMISTVKKSFALIPDIITAAPKANAALYMSQPDINPARFQQCDDEALKNLGIDGDIDCGVRYSLSPEELAMDPIVVVDYMLSQNYINEETGEAKPGSGKQTDYEKFIKYCRDRQEPWGETETPIESGDYFWAVGEECMKDNKMMHNFRVYSADLPVELSSEEDLSVAASSTGGGSSDTSGDATLVSASREELNKKIKGFVDSKRLIFDSKAPLNDINNGIAKDGIVSLLVTILEQTSAPIRISVFQTGHSRCSSSGYTSNHFGGNGMDIANEEVAGTVVPFLYNNREKLNINELIFSPMPGGTQTLKQGAPSSYSPGTLDAHKNHIHISYKAPKVLAGCPKD